MVLLILSFDWLIFINSYFLLGKKSKCRIAHSVEAQYDFDGDRNLTEWYEASTDDTDDGGEITEVAVVEAINQTMTPNTISHQPQ